MKKLLIILFIAALLLGSAVFVFSDQNGTDKWCNIDEYGCWVTEEDGGKSYIYFWSEEARKYIMGDLSENGSHVVAPYSADPDYGEAKLPLMDPPRVDYLTFYDTTVLAQQGTVTQTLTTSVPRTYILSSASTGPAAVSSFYVSTSYIDGTLYYNSDCIVYHWGSTEYYSNSTYPGSVSTIIHTNISQEPSVYTTQVSGGQTITEVRTRVSTSTL